MKTLLRRVRKRPTAHLVLFAGALLVGSACTPNEAIAVLFQGNADSATRVAECESGMDPGAVSPTNDHGLFQINAVHQQQFEQVTGQPWSSVYDPVWNTYYARWLYENQGWGPWACRHAA